MRRKRRAKPISPLILGGAAFLGIVVGLAISWQLLAPAGPLELRFVGRPPVSAQERASDGHFVRVYEVPGDLDEVTNRAQAELTSDKGWQPMLIRRAQPKLVQFTRIRSPRGDFQFVRVFLEQEKPNVVRVELDEGTPQRNAFK